MRFHNISQDYFGVTTDLMTLLKSYIVSKQFGSELILHNDSLLDVKYNSDIPISVNENFFQGISVETFRSLKKGNQITFEKFIKSRFFSKTGKECNLTWSVPEKIVGETVMFFEWFPKIYPVKVIPSLELKIILNDPPKPSNATIFHVKNKSLLNVGVDIEITDFVISKYLEEFNPPSISFVGGCKEMVEFFSKKYSVEPVKQNYYRPLYHREKGDMKSILRDIWMCANTEFVTNDFLHQRYYKKIQQNYTGIPNEVCFFNSIQYKKHIFNEDLFMSNYFDLFVILQKKYKFITLA